MKIAAHQIAVLSQALMLEGFDTLAPMKSAGLPDQDEVQRRPWRDGIELDRMMDLCRSVSGDEGFGLVVATSLAQMRHGTLAMLALHAPTLRVTLDDLSRFFRIGQDHQEVRYCVEAGVCSVHFDPLGGTADARRFRAEQIMGGLMAFLRFCGLADEDLLDVAFSHDAPAYAKRYEEIFGASGRFGQAAFLLRFRASILDAERVLSDAGAYATAHATACQELAAALRRSSVTELVRRWVKEAGLPRPGMKDVAARIGVSERTLRRQLGDEGTTFAEIIDEMKITDSKQLILLGTVPLKQIAEQAGYESASNFHRAFKNRTGFTPIQWRERHGAID